MSNFLRTKKLLVVCILSLSPVTSIATHIYLYPAVPFTISTPKGSFTLISHFRVAKEQLKLRYMDQVLNQRNETTTNRIAHQIQVLQ